MLNATSGTNSTSTSNDVIPIVKLHSLMKRATWHISNKYARFTINIAQIENAVRIHNLNKKTT